jgi:hypothetical protein
MPTLPEAVVEFSQKVAKYRKTGERSDLEACEALRNHLSTKFESRDPAKRDFLDEKLRKDFAAVCGELDALQSVSTAGSFPPRADAPFPEADRPVKAVEANPKKGIGQFFDDEDDDEDSPPTTAPRGRQVGSDLSQKPLWAPQLVVAQPSEDNAGGDAAPVASRQVLLQPGLDLEDRTSEYKNLEKECLALQELHVQLQDHVLSQDQQLSQVEDTMLIAKDQQILGTKELVQCKRKQLKFFVHKSSGIGGTAGLAVGGVVAIFAAPAVAVVGGITAGAVGGAIVGKTLKTRWKRRLRRLDESLGETS